MPRAPLRTIYCYFQKLLGSQPEAPTYLLPWLLGVKTFLIGAACALVEVAGVACPYPDCPLKTVITSYSLQPLHLILTIFFSKGYARKHSQT